MTKRPADRRLHFAEFVLQFGFCAALMTSIARVLWLSPSQTSRVAPVAVALLAAPISFMLCLAFPRLRLPAFVLLAIATVGWMVVGHASTALHWVTLLCGVGGVGVGAAAASIVDKFRARSQREPASASEPATTVHRMALYAAGIVVASMAWITARGVSEIAVAVVLLAATVPAFIRPNRTKGAEPRDTRGSRGG